MKECWRNSKRFKIKSITLLKHQSKQLNNFNGQNAPFRRQILNQLQKLQWQNVQNNLKTWMIARLVIMYFINSKKSRIHLAISARMPSRTLFCRKRTTLSTQVAQLSSRSRMLFRFLTLRLRMSHLAGMPQGEPPGA